MCSSPIGIVKVKVKEKVMCLLYSDFSVLVCASSGSGPRISARDLPRIFGQIFINDFIATAVVPDTLVDLLVLVVHIINIARALPVYLVDRPQTLNFTLALVRLVDLISQLVLEGFQHRFEVVVARRGLALAGELGHAAAAAVQGGGRLWRLGAAARRLLSL